MLRTLTPNTIPLNAPLNAPRNARVNPNHDIEPALRLSPIWFVVAMIGLGPALVTWGDLFVAPVGRSTFVLLALLCFGLAALIWGLEQWWPGLSRWTATGTLFSFILLTMAVFQAPSLYPTLILPPLLAMAFLGLLAGGICAVAETLLLLLLWQFTITVGVSPITIGLTIGLMWAILALQFAIVQPFIQRSHWSATHFTRAQHQLDEAREQRVQLAQMQEELKTALYTQEILNNRLETMRLIAEEAQQAKATFVAKISHEFRTPLNMILGLIDTVLEAPQAYQQPIPPLLTQDLTIVQRNTNHLADMISDVLDLSQAEAGHLILHREWVDLAADIHETLAAVIQPLLQKKGLALTISVSADFPQIYCDPIRIRQVILNLASNAARHTDCGGITVAATQQQNEVLISVTDSGPGIPPQDLTRVFEPFYQGVQTQAGLGGSGLGLNICQQLIERHQGRIWAESEVGLGSTFSFTLPIGPPDSSLSPSPKTSVPHQREDWVWHERATWPQLPEISRQPRLVICDEHDDLMTLINQQTDTLELVHSRTLPQAIADLQQRMAHTLILNAATPEALFPLIEQARQALPLMPIIGSTFPPRLEYVVQAGAVDYLIKPIRQAELNEALEALDLPLKRIMLVDDNADMRQLLRRMLMIFDEDLEISTAAGGAEALAILHQSAQQTKLPDLVLLDILMPDLTGWQVLAMKQQDATISAVPVIAVSGEDLVEMPTHTPVLLATMGDGVSVPQLLQCAGELSRVLTGGGERGGE